MAQIKQFRLPDAGEGLTEAEIVSWKVKPGDTIAVNSTVVEIETAKSLVELPSPFAGVVTELLAEEGQTVEVGTPIISVDVDPAAHGGAPGAGEGDARPTDETEEPREDLLPQLPAQADEVATDASQVQEAPEEGAVEPGLIGGAAPGGRTSVLVGYGPRTTEAKRRPRRGPGVPTARQPTGREPAGRAEPQTPAEPAVSTEQEPSTERDRVLAKPPVRKLAKDLGIELSQVPASAPGGVVTREDVLAFSSRAEREPVAARPEPAAGERETRVPVKGVRKMTAQAMVTSAFTAPHVTEFVAVDVTRTMRLVERLRSDREFADLKVSPLLLVAKALLIAVRRNPEVNASWDEESQEIVVKHYVNLGIAAATPRGLVVPNVKDADRLSLRDLAKAIGELTATAREGRTQPADMAGGTISITNVGVFGVDTGTPILNPGEAAILCLGAVRRMPWVHKGKVRARWVTQLGLSFDHRLVDGDLGSRFLADVAAVLERPDQALVWA